MQLEILVILKLKFLEVMAFLQENTSVP